MNATFTAPIKTRIAAFAAAILTSTVVLGATVPAWPPATRPPACKSPRSTA